VALEVVLGASLSNVRAIAVMKHHGTNVFTDFLMHLDFTGVAGGLVLISADDPGGLSSQNEKDSRILVHTYANLPVCDPCSATAVPSVPLKTTVWGNTPKPSRRKTGSVTS
jgi:indolepyruvate ferredoxin oxidoreductase alpha subunit